ncbi:MAG: YdeI/OmpD-associated family protein [Polyangiaceae bacterium]
MARTFTARIVRGDQKDTMGLVIPAEIVESLGGGKRPAVTVRISGHTYRSTIARMGGEYLVGIAKEHRGPSGITDQTETKVTIALDTEPRTVTLPAALAKALKEAGVREAFDALAPSRKKEAVRQVESAKAEATRDRRIAKIVADL